VVADMCTQLALKARQKAQTEEWALLRTGGNEKEDVPTAVEAFLEQHLMSLAKKKPEHYNENEPLGEAIQEAVALVDILEGWPQGLRALSDMMKVTTEALVTSTEPIRLPEKELTQQMAEGLCALMWVRPTLEITLDGCTLSSPKCLVVLARTLRPTVKSLSLKKSNIAKDGNDLLGLQHLCSALKDERRTGRLAICLDNNFLKPDAGKMLAEALQENKSVTSLRWAAVEVGDPTVLASVSAEVCTLLLWMDVEADERV
jgi:hypothetical protein